MKKTKNTIEIASTVDLDEISTQLIKNLTTKELVRFVLNVGDNVNNSLDFFIRLKDGLKDTKQCSFGHFYPYC
jgi:hypothetical protein